MTSPVVTARGLTRVYGEGETAVHALRGVDLDITPGQLTAVMGPSGSGKSTLMHVLAGLDKPAGRHVLDRRRRGDGPRRQGAHRAAPRAHRLHLPVLQPAADAHGAGEHPAAGGDRGRRRRRGVAGRADRQGRAGGPHRRTARASSPAASSSASRWRGRSRPGRPSCSPTSRRATSTPRTSPGDPRPAARRRRRLRPDDRDGHPRPARRRDRRPRPAPRGRPDRRGTRSAAA